jgi:hypothetical protein
MNENKTNISISNKTITVDLSSKISPTNIRSNNEIKMKNYLYKPKLVNLNLSPNEEKSKDYNYHSNLNVQTEIYLETNESQEISETKNSKQSPENKKDFHSLSKDLSNLKLDVINNKYVRIMKIDLKSARSLSKNRKYSVSSADSVKFDKNVQEDYSSNNFSVNGLNENLFQERINKSLGEKISNLQSLKEEKFGRSVSPRPFVKEIQNVEISLDTINESGKGMSSHKSIRTLNLMRLKNKLKTNVSENEK